MKWITMLLTIIVLKSCGSGIDSPKFKIKANQKTFTVGDTLQLSVKNNKNRTYDSIHYFLKRKKIKSSYVFSKTDLLGDIAAEAVVFSNEKKINSTTNIRLLNDVAPVLYSYTLVNEFPHDSDAYTQGLEFFGDELYESTGLKGKSSLRRINYKTGVVDQKVDLDKSFFGEGLTLLNDEIVQLTWLEKIGLVYDRTTMKVKSSFTYDKSKEGWGLCNDGTFLYKSDGTAKIWKLDPETKKELSYIQATTHKSIVKKINELEWVNGQIFANTYQDKKDVVVIINPKNGAITGLVNFAGLRDKVDQIPNLNVLNGIAYHEKRNTFFVTGKNWSKMFEVTLQKNK